jgi:signal transduction histidine kinase
MNEDPNISSTSMKLEEAQEEILALRRQLDELRAQNQAMWTLLAEVSRRLQTSSTSIKAAASSLLEHDIFWDGSNQHEFLEAIDTSVDQGADLITLMMLAFRSEANTLELQLEPHTLQEILSAVLETVAIEKPEFNVVFDCPPVGTPVLVDYEYLAIGLRLLLDVLMESRIVSSQLTLRLVELEGSWLLDILDTQESVTEALNHLCQNRFDELMLVDHISPENVLKFFTASRIIQLQNIELDVQMGEQGETSLRLTIPTVSKA